ncbi:MAG: hypothetical protein K2G99_06920, partial [Desulfovibrio sp.]|nr:hypothetical protein [Desulfovibrio sp.]
RVFPASCPGKAFFLSWAMFAVAHAALAASAGEVPGRLFTLAAPPLPWLAPGCILAGVALQLLALFCARGGRGLTRGRLALCIAGALIVFAGAALDRDVTVAVGEALALAGLLLAWRC